MPRSNYDDDDFETINGVRVLKDGRTLRVGFNDGLTDLQKAIAADSAARRARDAAIDPVERDIAIAAAEAVARSERTGVSDGTNDSFGLHRPGFRFAAGVTRDTAIYDKVEQQQRDAYRGSYPSHGAQHFNPTENEDIPKKKRKTPDFDREFEEAHGSGRPRRKRPDDEDDEEFQDGRRLDSAQLAQQHEDRMARLYDEIEREKLNEWRNPPK